MNSATSALVDLVFALLYGCDLIYSRMPRPRDDLLKAAEIFAGDIADMAGDLPAQDVREAFREHRKSSPYYPRPSDINRILVYIRARRFAPPPLQREKSAPGDAVSRGVPEACRRALRGDEDARALLEALSNRFRADRGGEEGENERY